MIKYNKLKKIMKDKDITGYELGKDTGIAISYIYAMLNGDKVNPSTTKITIIADYLGVAIEDLIQH